LTIHEWKCGQQREANTLSQRRRRPWETATAKTEPSEEESRKQRERLALETKLPQLREDRKARQTILARLSAPQSDKPSTMSPAKVRAEQKRLREIALKIEAAEAAQQEFSRAHPNKKD
jgi:hypothetical protein